MITGAGTTRDNSDGLGCFERGWSTGTRPVYFCGRILDRLKYEEVASVICRRKAAMMNDFRVYLRALELDDWRQTHAWRSDPGYQEGVISQKRFISSETEKRWVENAILSHEQGKAIRLAIVLKETDELIGMMYLTDIDYVNKNADGGAWIGSPSDRGKGLHDEAAFLAFKYAFDELGLERLSARVLESNNASQKAVEKFGFRREGVLRRAVFRGGRFHDVIVYSLLSDEFYREHGIE